jgi:hypothetical protein
LKPAISLLDAGAVRPHRADAMPPGVVTARAVEERRRAHGVEHRRDHSDIGQVRAAARAAM